MCDEVEVLVTDLRKEWGRGTNGNWNILHWNICRRGILDKILNNSAKILFKQLRSHSSDIFKKLLFYFDIWEEIVNSFCCALTSWRYCLNTRLPNILISKTNFGAQPYRMASLEFWL